MKLISTKMPLVFSENKETHNQQVGLFENFKDCDYIRNYNSCFVTNELLNKQGNTNKNYLKAEDNKSLQDLSLVTDYETDKTPKHVYISEDIEEDFVVETTALKQTLDPSNSTLDSLAHNDNYLTVSGTIKRGKKKGQNVEVILNMSREELEILEANITKKNDCNCKAKSGFGIHIFLWSVLCLPFSFIISALYSFYIGTITWYNVFTFFSEKKPIGYRVLVPPLLIILYPFLIMSTSLGLGLYASFVQLSCCWDSWIKEFTDYEKGFNGWLCNSLDIPECSPYEVVILSNVQKS